jgi:hypothetical protein
MRIAWAASILSLFFFLHSGAVAGVPTDARRGYLGVGLGDAPPGGPGAAMVGQIDPNGPAAKAGLRRGDLIRAVNGHAVESGQALQSYIFSQRPGAVLVFDVMRRGPSGYEESRVTATLASSPGAGPSPTGSAVSKAVAPPSPPPTSNPGAGQTNLRYVSYTDPVEGAFIDPVPAGWRVGGRMVRYGPVTIAPFVQAMTPDGSIFVQIGDWRIKDYADTPGATPGQLYFPGTSIFVYRRFETSEQYARSYSLGFARQLGCESPSFTGSEALPPASTATVPQAKLDTHLVSFACQRSGQRYVGRVMVTVQSYRVAWSTSWDILYLAGMLAREDRSATGVSVFDKMRNGFAFDSAWNAKESRLARAAIQPAKEYLDNTLKLTQAFDQNVINGTITVKDPTTGTRSETSIGAEPFYFSDGQGRYYNSYDPTPRSGFHAVSPVQ